MVGLMLLLSCARLLRAQESISVDWRPAQQLETEGRWNEAAEAYRQILAIDPKSIAALNRLGALYVRRNQFAEGKKFYREALQVDPQNFGTNLNLGIALLKEQDYPRAVSPLQQAVKAQT